MKRILSILLVFVFFYSIIGFYLNFEIKQFRIKKEIKENLIVSLPENELTLLKISSTDNVKIKWMEEGKEFRYMGNMFDVVKIVNRRDSTYFYCYSDSKESKLISHLDKLVKEQAGHSQSRSFQKKQVINLLVHEVLFTQCLPESPYNYYTFTSGYKFIYTDVLTPPPIITFTV